MQASLSLKLFFSALAVVAGSSLVQARPAFVDLVPPTASSLHQVAYRTVCDRDGDGCRRVWIDNGSYDGFRARERVEYEAAYRASAARELAARHAAAAREAAARAAAAAHRDARYDRSYQPVERPRPEHDAGK